MRVPPRKQHGQGTGPRRVNGALLDVASGAVFLGVTEKALRARVARRLVPFRRFGGRLVFVRAELETFVSTLAGCSVSEAIANVNNRIEASL
jgi:hypothetical protein